jgi:hypothetical protein
MTDILGQFREDDLPPSEVDVQRAVRTGRRRRRRRTGVVAASVVAALTLGAATAPQWLNALPGRGDAATPGRVTCDLPLQNAPTTVDSNTLASFDVLQRWINVGGINGFEVVDYETARLWQRVRLQGAGETTLDVVLYAQHVTPIVQQTSTAPPAPVDLAAATPTDVMAGAHWLSGGSAADQGEVARLVWPWAPDAWVLLTAQGPGQLAELRATAAEVATALRVGPNAPVYSPFMIQVPKCTRLLTTSLLHGTKNDGTPWTRFSLGFATADIVDTTNPWLVRADNTPSITVSADSGATPADKPGSATLEVDERPASYVGGLLVVYNVDGFALEVFTTGDFDAAIALFRTVYVHPGAKESEGLWHYATVS